MIRKTSVEIDTQLLDRTRELLKTSTVRETIDRAFREVLRAEARRQEVDALSSMDGLDLDKPEVMAGAWRS